MIDGISIWMGGGLATPMLLRRNSEQSHTRCNNEVTFFKIPRLLWLRPGPPNYSQVKIYNLQQIGLNVAYPEGFEIHP